MITWSEDIKGNAKCKNSRLSHPFGDLGVTQKLNLKSSNFVRK